MGDLRGATLSALMPGRLVPKKWSLFNVRPTPETSEKKFCSSPELKSPFHFTGMFVPTSHKLSKMPGKMYYSLSSLFYDVADIIINKSQKVKIQHYFCKERAISINIIIINPVKNGTRNRKGISFDNGRMSVPLL